MYLTPSTEHFHIKVTIPKNWGVSGCFYLFLGVAQTRMYHRMSHIYSDTHWVENFILSAAVKTLHNTGILYTQCSWQTLHNTGNFILSAADKPCISQGYFILSAADNTQCTGNFILSAAEKPCITGHTSYARNPQEVWRFSAESTS